MSLATLSREAMRGLKAQTDEENRLKTVAMFVNNLYSEAVRTAKMTEKTLYAWRIPQDPWCPYVVKNGRALRPPPAATLPDIVQQRCNKCVNEFTTSMADILKGLQELFPDCLVEHKILTRGSDGKMHDIPKMDKAVLQFVCSDNQQSYIVIDWS